jgi:hypothetical protein
MFSLTKEQQEKLDKWENKIDKKVAKKQGTKEPYYGATGGSLTYCFTPTSIGTVIKVKHGFTNEEIDLSDYESW